MATRQRTFDLIPTSLVKSNGPKPPMTSKAAKKAHQLATRGPKVSRAEQRRQDAEELARQKKEYEREKAGAKAKAAREKKAAKEQADRELRKKNGIPEPSRFVRASQPTISRFVKNGNKRTWQEMETHAEESDVTTVGDEEPDQGPIAESHSKSVETRGESEDEYGGFPSFSQSELGTALEGAESPAKSDHIQKDGGLETTAELTDPNSKEPPIIAAAKQSFDDSTFEDTERLDDMAATKLLLEAADAAARSRQQPKPSASRNMLRKSTQRLLEEAEAAIRFSEQLWFSVPGNMSPKSTQELLDAADKAIRSAKQRRWTFQSSPPRPEITSNPRLTTEPGRPTPKPVAKLRTALQERSINMPPPPLLPLPPKEKRSISFAPSPPKPQTLPRLPAQPMANPSTVLPSSTQAFLGTHLDDYFPSPSQEIRELLDDIDDLPSNTQIARELESEPDSQPPNFPQEDCFADLICTQDLVLSSQDILEITTPCPPPSKFQIGQKPTSTPTPVPMIPTRQPRRRFFEEKDEDLMHGSIQDNKVLAANEEQSTGTRPSEEVPVMWKEQRPPEREVSGKTKRSFSRTLSNATDYGEDEFHDCEDELLALC